MSADLSGYVAVISGGLGDIGSAIALELARSGADIAVCDLAGGPSSRDLQSGVEALGARFRFDVVDVSNAQTVSEWIDAVDAQLGPPNLIIANAAIVREMPFLQLEPDYWRKELSVNLDGAFHLASIATRNLVKKSRPGRVVFIGSWAAIQVHPQIPAYCVAKAGMRMLMKCMAAELAPHRILVNELAPGYVDAGIGMKMITRVPESRETLESRVPIGRLIAPHEVAWQVAHLCDPENRHTTGATILMDGGLSLFGLASDDVFN